MELNGNFKEIISENENDIVKEIENYFNLLGKNERLEKVKLIKLICWNKNMKKDDFLIQKRRRKQFENESNFGEWKEVKK